MGASKALLDKAGVPGKLPSGESNPGILLAPGKDVDGALAAFIEAVARHRHLAGETDPPQV